MIRAPNEDFFCSADIGMVALNGAELRHGPTDQEQRVFLSNKARDFGLKRLQEFALLEYSRQGDSLMRFTRPPRSH